MIDTPPYGVSWESSRYPAGYTNVPSSKERYGPILFPEQYLPRKITAKLNFLLFYGVGNL